MLKQVKRLIGGVAAVGLALIMLPTPVFAAEGDVAQIGDKTYATLDEAIAAASSGDTIELLADAQVTKTLNKTMTIDGNDHVLTSKDVRYGFGVKGEVIHLTLKNMTASFDYTIEVENPTYDSDLSLFYINADTDFTFENVTMNMDGSGASNRLHGFYYDGGSTGKFELTDSTLNIKNFPEDGFEWSGSSSNMNMKNSAYYSDNNRSGFAGTFNVNAEDSEIYVQNSMGNGSNGSNFNLKNSIVDFSDNGSHGLSAGTLVVDHSTVTANRNGGNGIHTSASLTIRNGSDVTVSGNQCTISSQWTIPGAVHIGSGESSIVGSTVAIVDNNGSGIFQKAAAGTLDIEDSATVTITGNSTAKCNTGIGGDTESFGGGIYANGAVSLGSGVTLYNNHAVTGGDDIYCAPTGQITFAQTGSSWNLDGQRLAGFADDGSAVYEADDCLDTIDGWYDDSADARWEAHASTYDDLHVEEYAFEGSTTTVTDPLALKAAHGLLPASVQPADITIYMGGDEGFEGVIDDNNEITGSDSLPEPGFYITLPDSVNDALGALVGTADEPANLSNYIQVYVPSDDPDQARHWTLEQYGNSYSAAYGKYIYRIVPAEGQDPIRLEFTDEDGNTYVSDEFDPMTEEALHRTYGMSLYAGGVDFTQLVMQVTIPDNGGTFYCAVNTVPGTLSVRYVTGEQDDVVTGVVTDIADAEQAGERAYAQVSESAKFFINGSDVDVTDAAAPSLLFDDVVTDADIDGATYDQQLANRAADVIRSAGNELGASYFEAKYLDLVDANNGNTWLTSSEPVTVYWPYPEGTDQDTEFHLVHFQGLDRELGTGDIEGAIANASTQYVEVENTEHGIRFTTDGFSPFVLVWEQPEQDTTTTPEQPVTPEKPSTDQKPTTENIPATGDTALMTAATVLVAAAAVAGTGLVLQRRKR